MSTLLAFHNQQETKDFYISRVKAHYEADEIIKGSYWQNGKGCAVGCTIHSSNHLDYEKELGISRIIARLEDGIFEGLPNSKAKEFPLQFLNAITVGADLSMVFPKFMHWLLVHEEHGIIKFVKNKAVVQKIADLYLRKMKGENVNINEWLDARQNAYAAAYDAPAYVVAYAAAAAYSAAAAAEMAWREDNRRKSNGGLYSADAAGAAYAAAAYAAYAAASQKARVIQAEKLLSLLSECK